MAVGPRRVGEKSHYLGILVDGRIDQRREESKVVHTHSHQAFGHGLIVFLKEDVAPIRRRKLVKLFIEFQGVDTGFGI